MGWILSFFTVTMFIMMGNKWKHAPDFGIFVQIVWAYYAVFVVKDLGLLVGVFAILAVHVRNSFLWRKE